MEGRAIIVILVKLDTGIGHFAHLLQLHCIKGRRGYRGIYVPFLFSSVSYYEI